MHALLLALCSGVPALIYQVVWTREVALLAGGQLDAIATVVAAFFGGMALGSRWLGALCDRHPHPLRLYGILEVVASALAVAATFGLQWLGDHGPAHSGALLALSAAVIAPVTFLLGGTQPALLRSVAAEPLGASGPAGRIVGANTLGSVAGVGIAVAAIPAIGLSTTLLGAGASGLMIGCVALLLSLRIEPPRAGAPAALALTIDAVGPETGDSAASGHSPSAGGLGILLLAALAGTATLGFEVLAARMAGLRLGSSLYAWGVVLGLFLLGLGAGNLVFARRAATAQHPTRSLAWIELGAALWLAGGLAVLHPSVGAAGATQAGLAGVVVGILPAAFLMGGAFPFFARLAIGARVGGSFGSVAAWNTAGGIVGALVAPALLLPVFGLLGGVHACAGLNLMVAIALFARDEREALPGRLATALGAFAVAALVGGWGARETRIPGVISVEHGRNASAAVVAIADRRDLLVDGDPEASTAGDARLTEELLAGLSLSLHPAPQRFLEIGLGSGITLGTAARFPLESLECVEIADAVIASSVFFEPDNRGVLRDPRVVLHHRDARVFLRGTEGRYDVVSANTLHPWSLGATGLYSREYFERLAGVLAPGGLVAQWIPVQRIGAASFGAILRTFFDVLEHGTVFWGANNVILIGSREARGLTDGATLAARFEAAGLDPGRFGLDAPRALARRRVAGAADVRAALGNEYVLHDDRPVLEAHAVSARAEAAEAEVLELLAVLAKGAAERWSDSLGMHFWLEGEAARARGDEAAADAGERMAQGAGLALASQRRSLRAAEAAREAMLEGRVTRAQSLYEEALRADPRSRAAELGLALINSQQGRPEAAIQRLRASLARDPQDAFAWERLASELRGRGRAAEAQQAIDAALAANPYYAQAYLTAGVIAVERGDRDSADAALDRLEELGAWELLEALRGMDRG